MDFNSIYRLVVSAQFCPRSRLALLEQFDDAGPETGFINGLERHGLASIAFSDIKKSDISNQECSRKILQGIEIRDRHRWSLHKNALIEVHQVFLKRSIKFVCLKGSAIANILYEVPFLRPMDDIDLLIKESDRHIAQDALLSLGFQSTPAYSGHLKRHHHLPPMIRGTGGEKVMIELHTEGLSRDHSVHISLDQLSEPLLSFHIDKIPFQTLGHIDHLRLLCRHTFGRRSEIKLLGVLDIIKYSDQYYDQIDWPRIMDEHSFIINTLRCTVPLTGLPVSLSNLAPQTLDVPDGLGKGMMPLRDIRCLNSSLVEKLRHLFLPPKWWVHVFYNVPLEKSIIFVRIFIHPLKVAEWLLKRLA